MFNIFCDTLFDVKRSEKRPSKHRTPKQDHINVDAASSHRIDIDTTLFKRFVSTGVALS